MLRNFFAKKPAPLTGAPAVRRMKSYSAQSGYVYQYFYEGQRPFRSGGESGIEYVFTVSADRKTFHPVSVLVGEAALRAMGTDTRPRVVFHRAICDFQDGVVSGLRRTRHAGPDEAGCPRAHRRCGSDYRDFGICRTRSRLDWGGVARGPRPATL